MSSHLTVTAWWIRAVIQAASCFLCCSLWGSSKWAVHKVFNCIPVGLCLFLRFQTLLSFLRVYPGLMRCLVGDGDFLFGLKLLTEEKLEEPPECLTGRDRRRTLGKQKAGRGSTVSRWHCGIHPSITQSLQTFPSSLYFCGRADWNKIKLHR